MTEDFTRPAADPRTLGQEAGAPARPPVGPPPVIPPPGAPAPVTTTPVDESSGDRTDTAKQEGAKVAETAKDQASQVAGTAKEEAQRTVGEAKRQAQDLLRQGQSELSTQADAQQERLASGLRSFSTEMNQLADGVQEPGLATQVARWASQLADDTGRWLEERDSSSTLAEVRRYASRNPGTFVLIAAGLGLAAGRVARSLKDAGDEDDGGGGTAVAGPTDGLAQGTAVGGTTPGTAGLGTDVPPGPGPAGPPPGTTAGTSGLAGGLR